MVTKFVTITTRALAGSADAARQRALLQRAQTACSASQAAGIIGLAWYSLVLGLGPLGAGAVFAAALAPVSAAGLFPRAARALLWRGRRPALWGGQLVMAAALGLALAGAIAGWPVVPIAAAFALGTGRALFDTAAASVLHALVDHERQHEALRELTQRYSSAQPAGIAVALVAGFVGGGPLAAIAAGAAMALVGAVASASHHEVLDHVPHARVRFLDAILEARSVLGREPRLRAAVIGGAVGIAVATGQAALLISWLAVGPDVDGERLVPTLLVAVLGANLVIGHLGAWLRTLAVRVQLVLALALLGAGLLTGWQAPDAATAAAAYAVTIVAGAVLVELATRAREEAVPAGLAPAIGVTAGAVWALAGAMGAMAAAAASLVLSLGAAFAALGGIAVLGGLVALWLSARAGISVRPARGRDAAGR